MNLPHSQQQKTKECTVSPHLFPHLALFSEKSIQYSVKKDKEYVPVCTDLEMFPELQRPQTQYPLGPNTTFLTLRHASTDPLTESNPVKEIM